MCVRRVEDVSSRRELPKDRGRHQHWSRCGVLFEPHALCLSPASHHRGAVDTISILDFVQSFTTDTPPTTHFATMVCIVSSIDLEYDSNQPSQSSESRLYTFSQPTKDKLRKFRLSTSRAKDPQATICEQTTWPEWTVWKALVLRKAHKQDQQS